MLQSGVVLDGKYEILKQIGAGGMSVVYLAMDKRLNNKQWAVKEIKREVTGKDNITMKQMLMTEANLLESLDHPTLPRIVNIIESGDTLYMVMDYIEGETLGAILSREGAQPEAKVISWGKTLGDVLRYLHQRQPPIIYRDMKPQNLMLKPDGNLKLIDFGIAREFKIQNVKDTSWLGTRGYAAPEQFGGQGQTDARTDIFGLGATLYHLVTGHDPSQYPYEMYPIRQWNPTLSEGFENILRTCTQFNPDDRYQSTEELLWALEHYNEIDQTFRRKQKKKLRLFIVTVALCLLSVGVGTTSLILSGNERDRDYDTKIAISTATDYETKIKTYEEAIGLVNNDVRAYLKLLDAYTDNHSFGDKEANRITALYNQNKEAFEKGDQDFLTLNHRIGTTFFYLYSGGDNSFRSRVLKSYPYFTVIVESENKSFSQYGLSESYYIIGNFYNQYVVNAASIKEPSREAYESLIQSMHVCMENIEDYDYDDASYIKLTMYQEIANLLYDHRKGLATRQIDKSDVLELLRTINTKAGALSVTQSASLKIQEDILRTYEEYVSAIESTYTNTEERM